MLAGRESNRPDHNAVGVQSFPSIFVLDPAGVIRFKDVRGDDLEPAVTGLLSEAACGPPAR